MGTGTIGFFGKLPSHGDFVARRVDAVFQETWDAWLERAIAASKQELGGTWLDCYLTSPIWRFFLSDGVAGAACFSGIMMPSVDRVGRYFPFTVVVQLPNDTAPLTFTNAARGWFESVESLCVEALQATTFDLPRFDAALAATASELPAGMAAVSSSSFERGFDQWRWALRNMDEIDAGIGRALLATAHDALRPMTMWWTDGSEHVHPSVLLARHLPKPDSYSALLTGRWDEDRWHGDQFDLLVLESTFVEEPENQFDVSSAGTSDCGPVRSLNEDCYALNDANRLWVVADGMGGHRDGSIASRMVADALTSVEATASLNTGLESVRIALERVNADLRRAALARDVDPTSGSTVVVLLIRGAQYAVCWAGDSRAYLYREGLLTQLTHDHVAMPLVGDLVQDATRASPTASAEITRAVGGDDHLELDRTVGALVPGDRFLLCSDGLHVPLGDEFIAAGLQLADLQQVADALVERARKAGSTDNATAVIVEARVAEVANDLAGQ
jgi:type VI secretion system protein ImpM